MVFYLRIGGLTVDCYPQNDCMSALMDSSNGKAFRCYGGSTAPICDIDCVGYPNFYYQGRCACVDATGSNFNCKDGNPFYSKSEAFEMGEDEALYYGDEEAEGLSTTELALIVSGSVLTVCGLVLAGICLFVRRKRKGVVVEFNEDAGVDNEEVDGDETEFIEVEKEVQVRTTTE